ncbi:sensor histidine kinase [Gordonia zhaorongruii]|uniref:sensor histidine kinase n=1 Tax=Gordonia zhaorongruii TaxID=2597659 RepID=UPI001F27046F|nr:sensor histidine kinase [Gordonia zhaorongruii]
MKFPSVRRTTDSTRSESSRKEVRRSRSEGRRTRRESLRRHLPSPSLDLVPDPAVRHYLRNRWNWVGLALAVTMLAVTWPNLANTHEVATFLLPALSLAASFPLALMFAGPGAVRAGWAVVVVTGALSSLIPHPGIDFPMPIPMFLVLLTMTFAVFCTQPLVRIPVAAVITAGAIVVGVEPGTRIGWIFGIGVLAVTVAFIRYRMNSQREIERHTTETEHAQAREAVLAERTRIARELHDVVAHRMSMVVVMSQTAKYRLAAADPAEVIGAGADAEFGAIADAARQSLNEVRQLLGVLRPTEDDRAADAGDPAGGLRPVHGVADLADLIGSVRAAGVDVDYVDRVADWGDPGATGAAVYRIVQESLTNAARHAPGADVTVRLDREGARVVVSVTNAAPSVTPTVEQRVGGGQGLIGMRERASAVGGVLAAGPVDDGGFAVTARLPVTD